MATNPMHQFNVYKIGPEIKINGVDLSFTNSSLFMLLSAVFIFLFSLLINLFNNSSLEGGNIKIVSNL